MMRHTLCYALATFDSIKKPTRTGMTMKGRGATNSVVGVVAKLNVAASRKQKLGSPKSTNVHNVVHSSDGDDTKDANGKNVLVQCHDGHTEQHSRNEQVSIDADGTKWETVDRRRLRSPDPKDINSANRTVLAALTYKTDKDWRNREPKTIKRRLVGQSQAHTIGVSRAGRKSLQAPGRRTESGVAYVNQRPGVIMWHHEMYLSKDNKKLEDGETLVVKNGKTFIQKGRYWIIVKVCGAEVWEVPIYTHHDTGLQNKDRARWRENFSVRPIHIHPAEFKNLSPTNPVLSMDWMDQDDKENHATPMRSTMVVQRTNVKKRSINIPELRVIGRIDDASTAVVQSFIKRD